MCAFAIISEKAACRSMAYRGIVLNYYETLYPRILFLVQKRETVLFPVLWIQVVGFMLETITGCFKCKYLIRY